MRSLKFVIHNNDLLDNHEVLKPIFDTLKNDDRFINFGYNKIIIITAIFDNFIFNFHHNVVINNDTSFEDYYLKVKDIINSHYDNEEESAFELDNIPTFVILVWNIDNFKNKHIKITSDARTISNKFNNQKRSYHNFINPLKIKQLTPSQFATMDIETIELNGFQIPILISLTSPKESKIFVIDNKILTTNSTKAVNDLWLKWGNYLENSNNINFKNIFIHNLGSFDGIFLFKALSNFYKPSQLDTIIDDKNKFIIIILKLNGYNLTFKDSYRIFPISLNELCKVFNVDGKISSYNINYNNKNVFKYKYIFKDFINYSKQDSIALYNALLKAQKEFISLHNVDITSIVSISSLAMKIFRTKYLEIDIPILNSNNDNFIRKSYYGGATDYYYAHVENAFYYDVNSLYPKAMCNFMPYQIIKKHNNMNNVNLDDFFGFCLAEIHCPDNIDNPMLPLRYNNKTIFPRGKWVGTYFSEELKSVLPLGYKIKLLEGIELSKIDLFTKYVNTFYKIKMTSTGSERWISKQLLNCLYGVFGRKQSFIETINVYNSDIPKYVITNIIKTIIPINDEISTLLIVKNIDSKLISELNNTCFVEIKN